MKPENYFKKTGKIYGLSRENGFGNWNSALNVLRVFNNYEKALDWIKKEEYENARKLLSRTGAIKHMGMNEIRNVEYLTYKKGESR